MDWAQVRADDLELPEEDDLGIQPCVTGWAAAGAGALAEAPPADAAGQ